MSVNELHDLVPDEVKPFFVSIYDIDPEIPVDVFTAFKGNGVDVCKAWEYGHDPDKTRIGIYAGIPISFIAPVKRFRFGSFGTVEVEFPNQYRLTLALSELGKTVEEILSKLRSYYFVHVNGRNVAYKILRYRDAVAEAKALIKAFNVPLIALTYTFGVKPSAEAFMLYIPRFAPLFRIRYAGATTPCINVMQMTLPETGKTFLANTLMFSFNYEYFTSMPSPARLVYDASRNTFGSVFTRNGLIFDEVDKWRSSDKQHFKTVYSILLSGIENGIWTRETRGYVMQQRQRFIPVLMFTNVKEKPLDDTVTARKMFELIVASWGGENPRAFVERFSIVQLFPFRFRVLDNITGYVTPPSLKRGLVYVIQKLLRLVKPPAKPLPGRAGREYRKLYPIIKVLTCLTDRSVRELTDYFVSGALLTVEGFKDLADGKTDYEFVKKLVSAVNEVS